MKEETIKIEICEECEESIQEGVVFGNGSFLCKPCYEDKIKLL